VYELSHIMCSKCPPLAEAHACRSLSQHCQW